MKKQFKKELMRNTIVYLLILFASLFLITVYFYGKHISKISEDDNQNFLGLMKSQTVHFLDHPVDEILKIEEQIIESSGIVTRVEEDYHAYLYRVEHLNEHGQVQATYPEALSRIGFDMSGNPFLNGLVEDEIRFSDTSIDPVTGKVAMMAGKKMGNGETIIGFMNLDKLQQAFSSFDNHGKIFAITDKKGNYILHPEEDKVATRSIDPNIFEIRNGNIQTRDVVKLSGKTYFVSYITIDNTGWYLLIYQNYYESLGPLFYSIFIVSILMFIAFVWVIRSFNRRFSKFEEGFLSYIDLTKNVIKGDYRVIEMNHEFIEFDELTKNFMEMIHEVEVREEEIHRYNAELQESRDEIRASNDELFATLQQLMAIEVEQRANELKIQERLIETELIAEFTSEMLVVNNEHLFAILGKLLNKVCKIKKYDYWSVLFFDHSYEVNSLNRTYYKNIFKTKMHSNFSSSFLRTIKAIFDADIFVIPPKSENCEYDLSDVEKYVVNTDYLIFTPLSDDHGTIGYLAFGLKAFDGTLMQEDINFHRILANSVSEAIKKDSYEKGLVQSREQAKAANIAKTQFLANMSHEIRTPLNGIAGYLQLIMESGNLLDIRPHADTAIRITQNMVRLIDDILDFSRIEAGNLRLINEALEVRAELGDAIEMYRFEAENRNIDMRFEVSDGVPYSIVSDATRIKQIISNLVSNSVKFAADGSIMVKLTMEDINGDEGNLVIIVSDSGIGISPEQTKSIFEPFNQGDNSSTRKFGGTGLGLSIVKQLVDMFSGQISVTSSVGVGTDFIVKIPVKIEIDSKDHECDLSQQTKHQESSARILVVDDNEINQLVVKKVLELKGFICDVAVNGAEALSAVQEKQYDCIFMDVQMPVMDGYEATRQIRELVGGSNLYIIAMTANAMFGDREKCIEAGMDDYISKPLDYKVMTELVRRQVAFNY